MECRIDSVPACGMAFVACCCGACDVVLVRQRGGHDMRGRAVAISTSFARVEA